jgi:hypothetical protein
MAVESNSTFGSKMPLTESQIVLKPRPMLMSHLVPQCKAMKHGRNAEILYITSRVCGIHMCNWHVVAGASDDDAMLNHCICQRFDTVTAIEERLLQHFYYSCISMHERAS